MNEFERRWQKCVNRGRQAAADPVMIPAGFASRTWARWTAQPGRVTVSPWTTLPLRALILATAVLLICVVTEFCSASADTVLSPHLEDVVTSVWEVR